jgi:hypothetical protein
MMMRRDRASASGDAAVSIAGDSHGPVTTTYIGTQVVGGSSVPLAVAVKDPRPVYTAVGVDAFTGRGWLVDEVDQFIASHPCGYVFVEAEAGLGKTAFAAWLVKTRDYFSHFARYAGGGSVQVALANLAAQLITNFGLDDKAPGGMLPEWCQTPGGFESLLAVAAESAHERQRSVVLVVDGLDEADAPGEGLPWGLPSLLPDGVYVVGTYRTGRSPRRPDAPTTTVWIAKDDQRNQRDILTFLGKAVTEDVLAARLAEASADQAEVIDLLANRCGGVWVYLRYVLSELRLGLRQPDQISDLPSGLRNYYADQIRRWQHDPAWHTSLLPLLATLGVAGEALPAEALARLAGNLDPVTARRWCDLTIRPLLTTTRTPAAGTSLRYEIYHASFRELLNPRRDAPPAESSDQDPYELVVLADELQQAAVTAHNSISDTYLTCFGGLDAGLPRLAADPSAADIDGGYPLRHLARHLSHAGRSADLHALLAAEHPAGSDRVVNTWFTAHDHADSITSYLEDLAQARRDSATATDQAVARHLPAESIGMEIRYALMASSITSRAGGVSAELLELLIRTGMWSPERGLDHARRLSEPVDRMQALIAVHSHVAEAVRLVIFEEALAAAEVITANHLRVDAFTDLAFRAPTDRQPDVLNQALDAACTLNDLAHAWALIKLAPHLDHEQLGKALSAATAIHDARARAEALTGLYPYLPADQQSAVLAQARAAADAISDDIERAESLIRLIPHLPAGQQPAVRAQALAAATASTYVGYRDRDYALVDLIPYLPADERPGIVAMILADKPWALGNRAIASLVPYLTADQRSLVIAEGMAATAAYDSESCARTLARLAPFLDSDHMTQAMSIAAKIRDSSQCRAALKHLAPHLPSNLLPQALTVASGITNPFIRADALVDLVPHLPADQRSAVLSEAWKAAKGAAPEIRDWQGPIGSPENVWRARAFTYLAPHLAASQQPTALAEALSAATAIGPSKFGCEHAEALTNLALQLPADLRPVVLAEALTAAGDVARVEARVRALTGLAPYLPAGLLARALEATTAIRDLDARVSAFIGLLSHLSSDQQPKVVTQALAAATAVSVYTGNGWSRGHALEELAPHLSPAELTQALTAASEMTNHYARANTFTQLAPYLDHDQLAKVLETATDATATARARDRGVALAGLAPYLPADLVTRALAAALAITDNRHSYERARALTELAPRLPFDQQLDVLIEALSALIQALSTETSNTTGTSNTIRSSSAIFALTRLVPHLPRDLLIQALEGVIDLSNASFRAEVLIGLAPHLPADLVAQAQTAVTTNGRVRIDILIGLAPYLPADRQPAGLERALSLAVTLASKDRAEALISLAPHLTPNLLSQALNGAATITDPCHRAKALISLAPHLTPNLLSQALKGAGTVTEQYNRGEALIVLAPYLPADLLTQALAMVKPGSRASIAILTRAPSAISADDRESSVTLIRSAFALEGADRHFCLSVIAIMATAIAEIGSTAAIQECVKAIFDVHQWWI